jgi:hypothetical protein
MRKKWYAVAAATGTGLLALGGALTGSGAAHAAQGVNAASSANGAKGVYVTSCNDTVAPAQVGIIPTCTSTGTVRYPTTIKLTVNSTELSTLLNPILAGLGQGLESDWTMSCYAKNTQILSESGSLTVKSSNDSQAMYLPLHGQTPSYCRVTAKASTLLAVSTGLLANIVSLGISDNVSADTAIINAVRSGSWCADTRNDNDNPGNPIQNFECISDHAQRWAYAPNRELVHEGRCLGYTANYRAVLERCTGAPDQIWYGYGRSYGRSGYRLLRANAGACLGIDRYRNGFQMYAYRCSDPNNDRWIIPVKSSY